MRLATLIAVVVLLGPLGPRAALADDPKEQARRDVTAGLAAQQAGRYDEAITLYKKAYTAIPHPELLFDLGQAYRLKGDLETAIDYYRRYLEAEPNGRVAGDAARWRADLGKRLADKRKADDARKADQARKAEDARKADEARRIEQARLAEDARKADEANRADEARKAEAARKAEEARKADEARKAEAARRADEVRKADEQGSNTAIWVAAAGGGTALVVGLVFGELAITKHDEALKACPDRQCASDDAHRRANDLLAQSRTRGTISTALVVLGAGGLVTSGILWWTRRDPEARGVAVAPMVGGGTLGVAIGGAL